MAAGLGIGWGINWGSIALSAKAVLDYLTFKLNFNTIATDFTFTRNSFATRVNEFGLIETVTNLGSDLVQNGSFDELSSELVTNGDFENGDTDWDLDSSWSVSDEKATYDASLNGQEIRQLMSSIAVGKTVKIQFDILNVEATKDAYLKLDCSGTPESVFPYTKFSEGTYTYYHTITSGFNRVNFTALNSSTGGAFSIDNISVKQLDPNDDWDLGSNWSIENNIATADGTQGYLVQTGTPPIGTSGTYKFEWTQEITSGTRFRIFPRNGNDSSQSGVTIVSGSTTGSGSFNTGGNCVGSGTFTVYIETTDGFSVKFLAESGNEGTIDNVSVVEVIEDDVPRIDYTGSTFDIPVLGDELVTNGSFDTDTNWTKQSGWSIANGVATFDINNYGGGNANIYQNCMVVGKEYVLTFDIVNYVQGIIRTASMNGTPQWSGNGTKTVKFIATQARIFMTASPSNNTILSIDNVSVKEVTAYTTTDKGAFLLEPISTNELIYSEDLSSWATFGSPIRTGGQDDLSGGTSAYAVEFPTANDFIRLLGVNTVGTFTASVYAKKSIGDTFYLNIAGNIGNYNFSTESFTPGTGSPTGDMIDLGNGWYRCIMTFSSTSTSSQVRIQSNNGSTVILWACQLEELPYATSYIPTSGTTVTRAQESCVDATPTINSEEGVLYAEISALVENDGIRIISLNDGTTDNRLQLYYSGGSNKIVCETKVANSTESSVQYVVSSQTDIHKVAFKYKENDFALWVDGVEVDTDLVGSVWAEGTLTELDFDIGSGSFPFYGRTKDLRIYDKALTDDELTDLTTI